MILGECALQVCLNASHFTFYEVTLPNLVNALMKLEFGAGGKSAFTQA